MSNFGNYSHQKIMVLYILYRQHSFTRPQGVRAMKKSNASSFGNNYLFICPKKGCGWRLGDRRPYPMLHESDPQSSLL